MSNSPRTRKRAPAARAPEAKRAAGPSAPAARQRQRRTGPRPNRRLYLDLAAITLFLIGTLLAVALIRPGSVGVVGWFLVHFIRLWMGSVVVAAPLMLIGGGVLLVIDYRRVANAQLIWGVVLLAAVIFGGIHVISTQRHVEFDSTGARFAAMFGRPHNAALVNAPDGGILGALVMFPLALVLERVGAMVVLGSMLFASVILLSDLTIRGIVERMHERSRIVAERARARARQRAEARAAALAEREAAGLEAEADMEEQALPARRKPQGRRQPLFLEVGDEDGHSVQETPAALPGSVAAAKDGGTEALPASTNRSRAPRRVGTRLAQLFSRSTAPADDAPETEETENTPVLSEQDEELSALAAFARSAPEISIPEPAMQIPVSEPVSRSFDFDQPDDIDEADAWDDESAPTVPSSAPADDSGLHADETMPAFIGPEATSARGRATRAHLAKSIFRSGFALPPLSLLDAPVPRPRKIAAETQTNIEVLESTLAQFRIQAQVVEVADGPSITRFEIRLGEGIRVKKILDLADNIAMSLAAMSVRVEAPIPGKAAIGIEVPKKQSYLVTMRECLEAEETRSLTSKVGFVLGKDVAGNVRCADLARMPHLLVAGATNSGKSVCLNVLIASMLFRARPDELKFIMIDPKRVELTLFDGIPHLIHPVVKDVKQAAGILRWVLREMDRRYDLFAHKMTRNIQGYNEKVKNEPDKKLPFLVVVIDELADLMMQQGPEVEQAICRLAQLARATGIHLVLATQRPSVDVITGLIKSNIPSRIAFAVSSQIDSRTILDVKGAENLIGRGDMLFKPVDAAKAVRIQGAFLREEEVEQLVTYLKKQGKPEYIAEPISTDNGAYGTSSPEEVEDELFEPAVRFVVTTGHASTSMIQRRFKIGYTRAARLVDMMEAKGIVGALDGAKPREILVTRDRVDDMFAKIRQSPFDHFGDQGGGDPFAD